LRNRPTRSLSTEEREKISSIASSKPKIDLEINFAFNSAVIGSKAMPQVTELGKALTSEDLKGRTFILSGFTDAKGSETYNQGLSEPRADAVKQFLLETARPIAALGGRSSLRGGPCRRGGTVLSSLCMGLRPPWPIQKPPGQTANQCRKQKLCS
jgi:hypothetical protein